MSEAPGGAANLAALGCDVTLRCPWAGNDAGDRLRELLRHFRARLDAFGLTDRTTVKNRYYVGGRLVARVDADGRTSVPPPPPESGGGGYTAAVLTDYGKGCFPAGVGVRAVDWEARVFADPKLGRTDVWAASGVETLVLNWAEAAGFSQSAASAVPPPGDDAAAWAYAGAARSRAGADIAVVKRSARGSTWRAYDGAGGHVPAVNPAAVADAQGAGDTYLAAFVAGRLHGLGVADAALFGSAAAGVAVSRPGTAVVSAADAAGSGCGSGTRTAASTSAPTPTTGG